MLLTDNFLVFSFEMVISSLRSLKLKSRYIAPHNYIKIGKITIGFIDFFLLQCTDCPNSTTSWLHIIDKKWTGLRAGDILDFNRLIRLF